MQADDDIISNLDSDLDDKVAFLAEAAKKSDFAKSLLSWHKSGRDFTYAQNLSIERMIDRAESFATAAVDLSPIVEMFDKASIFGGKPKYRAAGLQLNLATPHGKNPGAIYVKDIETGEYFGKIADGVYYGQKTAINGLNLIAQDPVESAVEYGRATGTCSCCGKKLTDPISVERGIGPICEARWF